jgi:hypothetical protein
MDTEMSVHEDSNWVSQLKFSSLPLIIHVPHCSVRRELTQRDARAATKL